MGFGKASLLLYFLLFLHLQHHSFHAISRSTTPLASADPNHDNLPVHSVQSKPNGNAFSGKTELAVVIHKGGGGGGGRGGGGGGGRGFGGGGRSFGGGGRSFGGGGRGKGGRGVGVVPFAGGAAGAGAAGAAARHGGHRSSAGRESASVWLGLSALLGLVFGF